MNGESTSMVWPTLVSGTANEQNLDKYAVVRRRRRVAAVEPAHVGDVLGRMQRVDAQHQQHVDRKYTRRDLASAQSSHQQQLPVSLDGAVEEVGVAHVRQRDLRRCKNDEEFFKVINVKNVVYC